MIQENLIGKKYHRVTILSDLGTTNRKRFCIGKCDCGKVREFEIASLKRGGTKSCGCLRTESNLTGNNRRTHGLVNHPLAHVWNSMKKRCYCATHDTYPSYGGKGVVVCDEWLNDFLAFYDWCMANGWQQGLEIDKDKLSPTKPGKLYSPEFCCFLTHAENMKYRSNGIMLTYNGIKKSLIQWCEELKLNKRRIYSRIRIGWDTSMAFETDCIVSKRNKNTKMIL